VTRPLIRVGAGEPLRLRDAIAAALDGSGPAVQPVDEGTIPLSSQAPGPSPAESVPDEVAVVLATSGSSGYPKRVAVAASALLASASATEEVLGGPGRWVLAVPAHYVAGVQVLVRSILAASDPVVVSGRFSEAGFVRAVDEARDGGSRTYTALVPAQVARLLSDGDGRAALASLDGVIVGGQAVPVALRERASSAGVHLVRTYGSSETSGGCVYDGRALAGVDVRITGGEIEIGGATLALGYLGDDARTAGSFRQADGRRWFRTGDTGALDGGVLEVFGRIDNVIVSGGVNVSLDRVESVVRDRPGFADAVVVGLEDDRWGAVPVVVGEGPGSDEAAVLDGLRAHVGARLGVAARPARLIRVDALPLLATGKPDRLAIGRLARAAASAPGHADG
jgi:O-succinylbenzoic acid--CoA ligase